MLTVDVGGETVYVMALQATAKQLHIAGSANELVSTYLNTRVPAELQKYTVVHPIERPTMYELVYNFLSTFVRQEGGTLKSVDAATGVVTVEDTAGRLSCRIVRCLVLPAEAVRKVAGDKGLV